MEHELRTLKQMARELRVPEAELRREATAGTLPCVKLGRSILFHAGAVREALAQRAACAIPSSSRPTAQGGGA